MALPDTQIIYGLRDIKIRKGSVQVDLAAAQTMVFSPEITGNEMRGDDVVFHRTSRISKATGSLSAGGYTADAIAVMTGKTITESGSSPNQTGVWSLSGGDSFPEFEVWGQAYGQSGGALMVRLFRCVITGGFEFNFADEEFFTTGIDVDILPDTSTGKIFEVTQQETAAAIPSPA